ncbi:cytochrome P450 [Actinomycetospora callitridis]|uniref:cytochrome P450 n=1 Tax=Actinomycetospora callitridis TaxID=913944 RepID=UPI0023653A7A|nr:cytochrome P450 [Actinomycetospora callitridis]MDD7917708.1 cytochrome P450 [Actinomycetospora callitridis]
MRADAATLPDLTDLAFWAAPESERLAAFAHLRALDRPVFFAEPRVPLLRPGGGFHALVRHADVLEASRHTAVFSSEPAAVSPEPPPWLPMVFGRPLVNTDDPRHARLRRIVSRAFAPRRLEALDVEIAQIVDEIVARLERRGSGDFVADAARELPIHVICSMLGIPRERRGYVLSRIDVMTEYSGVRGEMHRLATARLLLGNLRAIVDLRRFVVGLGRQRRRDPGDDILSALVTADVDGERLSLRELGSFFDLLLVAGNETVRNAASHGLVLLSENPGQRERLAADPDALMGTAIEEIVRICSPIIQFRRTLTRDHELRGHPLPAGSKVVLFYGSANRDEHVFDAPDAFDVGRRPNPHVGFGGPGAHLCLGAHLARRELGALFRAVLARLPHLRAAGPAVPLRSSFDHGIVALPYTV